MGKARAGLTPVTLGAMLTLTRGSTQRITKINVEIPGAMFLPQRPGSEEGRHKIILMPAQTVTCLTLISAVALLRLDVVAVAGGVVETFTNPTNNLKKLPIVGG
jgi:hypothetical protein